MSLESVIEETIRKAIERGEFDNLKGQGKPLDLTGYFNAPEDLRLAYSLLKANNFVPDEIEMLKEVARLKEAIAAATLEEEKAALSRKLAEQSLALTIALEKYKRKR